MIREFNYKKSEELTETRKVLILQENENNIAGLDLKYLSEEDQKQAISVLNDIKPMPLGCKEPIEGYNKEWSKAWRCFNKSKIVVEEKESDK